MEQATTVPARTPSFRELVDRVVHYFRLVGHECGFYAHGEIGHDARHRVFNVFLELQHVAAIAHVDGEADGVLSVAAEKR